MLDEPSVPFKRKYDSVFTTSEVARFCKVAPRTVSKWFDSGRLKGYRIPMSQDRRIPRDELIKFLKSEGMPLGELGREDQVHLMLVGVHFKLRQALELYLTRENGYEFESVDGVFTAGAGFFRIEPDVVIVDAVIGHEEAVSVGRGAKDYEVDSAAAGGNRKSTLRIVLAGEDYSKEDYPDFHDVYRQDVDPKILAKRIVYFRNGAPNKAKYK